MRELQTEGTETEVLFECNTHQLEETISQLGQLGERDNTVSLRNYPVNRHPHISVGKRGKGREELHSPEGIVFNERTQLIYVANMDLTLFSTAGSIKVFSAVGEYIYTFGKGQLKSPVGIAINADEIYVSDSYFHCIFHFKLPSFELVEQAGTRGAGRGEFSSPHQLTTAPNGSVFVADTYNNRVVILTDELKFRKSISHDSMRHPHDVKLHDNKIFVLSSSDNPCLHVFSQFGDKLSSMLTQSFKGNEQVNRIRPKCNNRYKPRKGLSQPSNYTLP